MQRAYIISHNEVKGFGSLHPVIERFAGVSKKDNKNLFNKSRAVIRVHRPIWSTNTKPRQVVYNIELEVIKNVYNEYLLGSSSKDTKETIEVNVPDINSTVKLENYTPENRCYLSPFLRKYCFYPDIKFPYGKLSTSINHIDLSAIKPRDKDDEPYSDLYIIDFGPKGYREFCRNIKSFSLQDIINNLPDVK